MRKLFFGILFFIAGIALVVVLFTKIDLEKVLSIVFGIGILNFFILIIFTLVSAVASNLRGQIILRSQGIEFSFWRLLWIWFAGNAFNYMVPWTYIGGEGVKGYFLINKFNVPRNKTISFIFIDKIVDLTSFLFMIVSGAAILVYYIGLSNINGSIAWGIFAIVIVFSIFAFFYVLVFGNKRFVSYFLKLFFLNKTRLGSLIQETEKDVVDFFNVRSKVMWQSFAISMLAQIAFLLRHIFLIYVLGRGIQISASILSLGALYVGLSSPVPGALGVQEWAQGFTFSILNWGVEQGLALSFIIRAIDVILVSLGAIILLRYGIGLMASGALYMIKTESSKREKEQG